MSEEFERNKEIIGNHIRSKFSMISGITEYQKMINLFAQAVQTNMTPFDGTGEKDETIRQFWKWIHEKPDI